MELSVQQQQRGSCVAEAEGAGGLGTGERNGLQGGLGLWSQGGESPGGLKTDAEGT